MWNQKLQKDSKLQAASLTQLICRGIFRIALASQVPFRSADILKLRTDNWLPIGSRPWVQKAKSDSPKWVITGGVQANEYYMHAINYHRYYVTSGEGSSLRCYFYATRFNIVLRVLLEIDKWDQQQNVLLFQVPVSHDFFQDTTRWKGFRHSN